jgi:hypothetical protein
MLGELVWTARVLRYGRDNINANVSNTSPVVMCTACGMPMNQHAQKVDFSAFGQMPADPVFLGVVQEIHQCAGCGNVQMRPGAAVK